MHSIPYPTRHKRAAHPASAPKSPQCVQRSQSCRAAAKKTQHTEEMSSLPRKIVTQSDDDIPIHWSVHFCDNEAAGSPDNLAALPPAADAEPHRVGGVRVFRMSG